MLNLLTFLFHGIQVLMEISKYDGIAKHAGCNLRNQCNQRTIVHG
jgi:hypothetical protein